MKAVIALLAVVLAALLVSEATMQPSAADRWTLLGVYLAAAAVTAVAGWAIARLTHRSTSLRRAVLLTAVGAVGAAAVAVLLPAGSMFLSSHDLRLVLVALGFGVALGVVLAGSLAGVLEQDVGRLRAAAERVAAGDRDARTGVERRDEIGALARAFDDMTARLADAEGRRERTEEARRAFLASVSHDLRTPLTSLRATLEALQDGVADDPDRYLAAMRRDVALLGSLVEDLFLLARIESGGLDRDHERVDLAELADEAVEAVAPVARRREVTIALDATGAVPVDGSARELSRILRNLLDNAVRHAPAAGEVRLRIHATDAIAEVQVHDDGPGFDAAFVARAFDSFTRADAARRRDTGGAGLGLAIARGLVEAHGGTIEAFPGPGGRVRFVIPLATR